MRKASHPKPSNLILGILFLLLTGEMAVAAKKTTKSEPRMMGVHNPHRGAHPAEHKTNLLPSDTLPSVVNKANEKMPILPVQEATKPFATKSSRQNNNETKKEEKQKNQNSTPSVETHIQLGLLDYWIDMILNLIVSLMGVMIIGISCYFRGKYGLPNHRTSNYMTSHLVAKRNLKVLVIGQQSSGKTTLIEALSTYQPIYPTTNSAPATKIPRIHPPSPSAGISSKTSSFEAAGVLGVIKMEIFDNGGKQETATPFSTVCDVISPDVLLVCVDSVNHCGLEMLTRDIDLFISKYEPGFAPLIISVRTKADITDEDEMSPEMTSLFLTAFSQSKNMIGPFSVAADRHQGVTFLRNTMFDICLTRAAPKRRNTTR